MTSGLSPDYSQIASALGGRYRIERELGTGGMATVYLAHDVRHDRKVAVKVLKPELAAVLGAERFLVEIKTTASLQHPHILPLFDSGEASGLLYYVMPYVQGETIREKLNRESQFGVDEAVRITREVADALDYAHRHGVIHRDIKPENILLHDGRAMVMDFGIALALSAAGGGRMTETGLSLGTPHYMSPEQATAERDLTPRTDIYSLACVLYEMLTGNPPHVAGSAQQIIMRIITDTPRSVSELRRSVPPNVSAAIAKALEKVPADRFETAKAFSEALATSTFSYAAPTGAASNTAMSSTSPSGSSKRAQWVFAGVAAVAIGVAAWSLLRPAPPQPVVRLDLTLEPPLNENDVAISPDGSTLAYAGSVDGAVRAVFVRRIDGDANFRMLPGTEGGAHPAFSPDGKWIVFHRERDGALIRLSTSGGGLTTLLSDVDAHNPHWGTPDRIVYNGPRGTIVISATGANPKKLVGVGGRRVFLLPDGSGVLGQNGPKAVLYDLRRDTVTELLPNARFPVYVQPGYLVFDDDQGGASAVRFDLKHHRVVGAPIRVLDRVAANVSARGFAVSNNGTLVQREGNATNGRGDTRLVVRAVDGKSADTLPLPAGRRIMPRFSPDGRRVAYSISSNDGGGSNIYVYDLVTGTNVQLTFSGSNTNPVWSPDGTRIAYANDSGPAGSLRIKRADNSAPEQVVRAGVARGLWPNAWPREDVIAFTEGNGVTPSQLMTIAPAAGSTPKPYLTAAWIEQDAALSPDGRLAAFTAREGGGNDVWLRDFPTPAGKWKLSINGGGYARWTPDGRYVYYWKAGPQDSLFRVRIDRTPSVVVHPREIVGVIDISGAQPLDFHPDGKRFIVAANDVAANIGGDPDHPRGAAGRSVVVLNWVAELEALVKGGPRSP